MQTYDVVNREDARASLQLAPPPIFVTPVYHLDNVPFFEGELARLGRLESM